MSDTEIAALTRAVKAEPDRRDLKLDLILARERAGLVYTPETWSLMWTAIRLERRVEIDRSAFYEALEILPPHFWKRRVTVKSGQQLIADFGFLEGCDRITAFWSRDGRYFAEITDEWGSTS